MKLALAASLVVLLTAPAMVQQAGGKLYREPEAAAPKATGSPSVEEFIASLNADRDFGKTLSSETLAGETFEGARLRGPIGPVNCNRAQRNFTDKERADGLDQSRCVVTAGRRRPA